jgi:citrate synthase
MVDEIGSKENVNAYLKTKFEKRERVMGFGHLIYKQGDPRAKILKSIAKELSAQSSQSKYFEIHEAIEIGMLNQKKLLPNIDFYSACIFKNLGFENSVFPAIFAVARFPSWIAHIEEQVRDNKIMVARAEYQGMSLRPVPRTPRLHGVSLPLKKP